MNVRSVRVSALDITDMHNTHRQNIQSASVRNMLTEVCTKDREGTPSSGLSLPTWTDKRAMTLPYSPSEKAYSGHRAFF